MTRPRNECRATILDKWSYFRIAANPLAILFLRRSRLKAGTRMILRIASRSEISWLYSPNLTGTITLLPSSQRHLFL